MGPPAAAGSVAALLLLAAAGAQAQANPLQRPARDAAALSGVWNGSHLEQRSNCLNALNNGFRGTYSEVRVFVDGAGRSFNIDALLAGAHF